MDWSSAFDSDSFVHNEVSALIERKAPPSSARVAFLESLESYTPTVLYAFCINYILGCGVLGVPYAFRESGLVLASIILITLSLVSFLTVVWVAEASHRGKLTKLALKGNPFRSPRVVKAVASSSNNNRSLLQHAQQVSERDADGSKRSLSIENLYSSFAAAVFENEAAATSTKTSRKQLQRDDANSQKLVEIGEPDVNELCSLFLGDAYQRFYSFALAVLTYVGLQAYSTVFCLCFEDTDTMPRYAYAFLFACIVVPLSCLDLEEQISVQIWMSVLRFFALGVLIVGTFVATALDPRPMASSIPPVLAEPRGFGLIFTTSIFAQLFQHSVPGLIRPLKPEDRAAVPRVFGFALFTTTSIYLVIGISCTFYFQEGLQESVNLNFLDFDWNLKSPLAVALAKALSLFVVAFPAFDTLSVFPLISITLARSLESSLSISTITESFFSIDSKERANRVIPRLFASVPPIVLSIFVTNLAASLQIAGLCGIIVALFTPALLQIASLQATSPAFLHTPYHIGILSTASCLPFLVLAFALIGLVCVCVSLYFSFTLV